MKAVRTTGILLLAFVLGVLSQHVTLATANAKSPVPQVVRARSFALVDRNGNTAGLFALQNDQAFTGNPAIVLYDSNGQIIWRASNNPQPVGATH